VAVTGVGSVGGVVVDIADDVAVVVCGELLPHATLTTSIAAEAKTRTLMADLPQWKPGEG
jgi:hypothetical protein